MSGKGSRQRPTDKEAFNQNFDRIFGVKLKDESVPKPPEGYTAEELERDNPYNQWMYEQ